MDNKLTQEERDILKGLQEILQGRGEVLTPAELRSRRRGRPPLPTVKVAVKIRLDADLLGVLRSSGAGWQTRINEVLRREFMAPTSVAQTFSLPPVAISLPAQNAFRMDSDSSNLAEFFHFGTMEREFCHA